MNAEQLTQINKLVSELEDLNRSFPIGGHKNFFIKLCSERYFLIPWCSDHREIEIHRKYAYLAIEAYRNDLKQELEELGYDEERT